MKRLVVLLMMVVACGNPAEPNNETPIGYTQYFVVETPVGSVPCISWKDGYGGGLSCDWRQR